MSNIYFFQPFWVFVYSERLCSNFIDLHVAVQLFQYHLLKRLLQDGILISRTCFIQLSLQQKIRPKIIWILEKLYKGFVIFLGVLIKYIYIFYFFLCFSVFHIGISQRIMKEFYSVKKTEGLKYYIPMHWYRSMDS